MPMPPSARACKCWRVREESLRNPEPIVLLQNEAGELEDKGEWAAAEAAHRRALECACFGPFRGE